MESLVRPGKALVKSGTGRSPSIFLLKSRLLREGIEREERLLSASIDSMFIERSRELREGREERHLVS